MRGQTWLQQGKTAGRQDGRTVRTSVFDQSKRTKLPVIFRLDDGQPTPGAMEAGDALKRFFTQVPRDDTVHAQSLDQRLGQWASPS
jgi:hypothetical protein